MKRNMIKIVEDVVNVIKKYSLVIHKYDRLIAYFSLRNGMRGTGK